MQTQTHPIDQPHLAGDMARTLGLALAAGMGAAVISAAVVLGIVLIGG